MKLKINNKEYDIECLYSHEIANKNNLHSAVISQFEITCNGVRLENSEFVGSYVAEKIAEKITEMINE